MPVAKPPGRNTRKYPQKGIFYLVNTISQVRYMGHTSYRIALFSGTYPQAVDKIVDKNLNVLQKGIFFILGIALGPVLS
jgi:hypothetical protein